MKTLFQLFMMIVSGAALVLVLLWMRGDFTEGRIGPGLNEPAAETIPPIDTVEAEYITMNQTAEAVGSIQSRNTATISGQILATILEVAVTPGERVNKGQLLIRLDDRDLRARLQQARNALEAARATHEKAKLDLKRYEALLKSQSVTENAYDEMLSAERIASAKLEQAREAVNESEVMLTYSKIYAPMDGIIIEKLCDPGDLASPGKPLLTMYDPENLRLEAAVRERLTGRLKIGDTVGVAVDALNREMTGRVEEIVPSADPASRSVTVKVAIPKEEGLIPGMYGRIKIPLDPIRYLVLPARAIQEVGQLDMVKVVEDGRLSRRAVRTGKRWQDRVEILSGIEAGEKVVVEGGRQDQ